MVVPACISASHNSELARLIELLQTLNANHEQHFHIASENQAPGSIGDIEVYLKSAEGKDNMRISSRATSAGEHT